MKIKEVTKRYILFIVSLFFSALGVAFTRQGELGVSPISSVANVLSIRYSLFSLGTWLIIWNCLLIIGQIVILRHNFQIIQLLQIPLSVLFGWFIDLCVKIVSPIPIAGYFSKMLMIGIGIIILGFGVSLAVIANVIMNSGEAFVKAIADTTHFSFGYVKIYFDVFCVILAVALSLLFFDRKIIGVREGTILTALLTGVVVKYFTSIFKKKIEKYLY